jgi:hypothetical protein
MTNASRGLTDKLYWRPLVDDLGRRWHCFKKCLDPGAASHEKQFFLPICVIGDFPPCRVVVLESGSSAEGFYRIGGQQCARPPAVLRCARCDILEMKRRGVEESMPELANWQDFDRLK